MKYSVSVLRASMHSMIAEKEEVTRKLEFEERMVNSNSKLEFSTRRSAMLGMYDDRINDMKRAIEVLEK